MNTLFYSVLMACFELDFVFWALHIGVYKARHTADVPFSQRGDKTLHNPGFNDHHSLCNIVPVHNMQEWV